MVIISPIALRASALALAAATVAVEAETYTKAANTTALNLAGSWTNATVPNEDDILLWNSTLTGANTTALGGSLSVLGLQVTNPAGAITIANTAGATLTIGSGGIDMSSAAQNLTINPNLLIGASQDWVVAGGRTLSGIAGGSTSVGTGTGNIVMSRSSVAGFNAGTANVLFNQNGNGTGWGGYSGAITVNAGVKLVSQGNAAAALGSGAVTLAGGAIHQSSGNWTWGNNISVAAASVIGNDSSGGLGRTLKLLGDLTSGNSSGLTFTNTVTGGTRTDNVGFILAGAAASTYGDTVVSANSRLRVGGNATATVAGDGYDAGARGSLGTGAVSLAAASSELAFTRTDAHAVANAISGSGTVVVGGNTSALAGTSTQVVTLSGVNTYTGATRVSRSRLNLTGSLTSAISVDTGGSVSGTGSTTGSLTLASGTGISLDGGAVLAGLSVNGLSLGGSNLVTFLSSPNPGSTYDVIGYGGAGSGAVTNPGNLSVAWRGTLTNDAAAKKFTFLAGASGTRTWNTAAGTWEQGGALSNFAEGDQKFYGGDAVVFGDIAADAAVTLSGTLFPASVSVANSANAYTFSAGALGGAGALAKSGAGTLILAAANSHSGGVTLSAGTLVLGHAGALGSGTLTLSGGSLDSSVASLVNTGNNAQAWNGDFSFVGTQSLALGTGAVTLGSNRTVTVGASTLSVGGVISGAHSLTKAGNGALTLSGANAYSGGTTLSAGVLRLGSNSALGTGALTLAGGTLSSDSGTTRTLANALVISADVAFGDGANGGMLHFDGAVNLQGGNRTLTSVIGTQGLRLNGRITNGTLTIAGSGRVTLANDSLENPSAFSGAVTVNAGALLAISVNALAGAPSVNLLGTGTLAIGGNGITTINNLEGSATSTVLSSFNIVSDGARTLRVNQSLDGSFLGSITQGGGTRVITLVKSGSAALTLGGSSTHTGGTTVSQGSLLVSASGALGSSGSVVLNDVDTGSANTALRIGSFAFARPVTVAAAGAGVATLGANGAVAAPDFSGAIVLERGVTLDGAANTDRLTFSGGISGTGDVTVAGTGRVVFNTAANTYSGATVVSAGSVLQLGVGTSLATSLLPDASVVTLGAGSFLKLAKLANAETVGGLSGSGTVRVHEGTSASASLVLDLAPGTQTFSGLLENGSAGSVLSLVKSGLGTQVLSGANTYTGGTTVSAGTLALGVGGALGSGSVTVASGATLDLNGQTIGNALTLQAGASLAGTGGGGLSASSGTLDFSAAAPSSAVALSLSGTAAVTFGSTSYSGDIAYAGGTVSGAGFTGRLVVSTSGVALGSGIGAGSVLLSAGSATIGAGFARDIRFEGGTLGGLSTLAYTGTVTVAGNSTLNIDAAGDIARTNAAFSVQSGSTLKGTGTFGGAVAVSGTLAPGNSPGLMTYESGLTLGAASVLEWEFDVAALSIVSDQAGLDAQRGVGYDAIDVTGGALSVASGSQLSLLPIGENDYSGPFWADTRTFGLVSLSPGVSITGILAFSNSTSSLGVAGKGQWDILGSLDGNDGVYLQWTPVPEPSTYGLILGGLALAGAALRRRRTSK